MMTLPLNRRLREQLLRKTYGYKSIRGVPKLLNLENTDSVYEYLEIKYNNERALEAVQRRKNIAETTIGNFLRSNVINRKLIIPDFIQFNPPSLKRQCYNAIRDGKLYSNSETANIAIYNFNNLKTEDDIRKNLINTWNISKKNKACKMSIQFGFCFEKMEQELDRIKYSYVVFQPSYQKYFINCANVEKIEDINAFDFDTELLVGYIASMRPSSSHKIIGITSMIIKVLDLKKYKFIEPKYYALEQNIEQFFVGSSIELPDYIKQNKRIISMDKSKNNMCFWDCMAYDKLKEKRCLKESKILFENFYNLKPSKDYQGIDINSEIERYESIDGNKGINIFVMSPDGVFTNTRQTKKSERVNLLLYGNHFSYIISLTRSTDICLSSYIKDNRVVISMSDSVNNMSFWDCIGYYKMGKLDRNESKKLFNLYYGIEPSEGYEGFNIQTDNIKRFESIFKLEVFEIIENVERGELWDKSVPFVYKKIPNLRLHWLLKSLSTRKGGICLLLSSLPDGNKHYSLITDFQKFQGVHYSCSNCGNDFKDDCDLQRHKTSCIDFMQKDKFSKYPTVYEPKRNLIVELNEIFETDYDFIFDPLIVYDFEALVLQKDIKVGKSTIITNEQRAVSVSICSNVIGYEEPLCIINESVSILFKHMFEYLVQITEKAVIDMTEKYSGLLENIGTMKDDRKRTSYVKQLNDYMTKIPVLGFNSGKYDINLNINEFMNELNTRHGKEDLFCVKNGNNFKFLKSGNMMFLDICQYLPPSYNLDAYIKAFNKDGLKKGIFPYEYMNSFEKVDSDINLLTKETFFSKLKNKGITTEEWEEFEINKKKYAWKTLRDLLIYYNNLDVKPFLDAILVNKKFFYELKIDMFKDGMSLPSLAEKTMFSFCFKKFNEKFLKKQIEPFNGKEEFIIDGLTNSTIKSKLESYKSQDVKSVRYDAENFIEQEEVMELFKIQNCKCKYCWTQMNSKSKLETEDSVKVIENDKKCWTLDRIENSLGHNKKNCVLSCLSCNIQRKDENYNVFYRKKALVRYSLNNPLIYLIDEENKIVFDKLKANITGGASIVFHRHHEAEKTKIKRPIYNVETHEWEEGKEGKTVKNITGFDANALYLWCIGNSMPCGRLKWKGWDNKKRINEFINDFNGFVEVDIHTPENLYNEMGEFPLIFKNIEYDSYDVMGEYMEKLYEEEDKDKKEKKRITSKLISSFKGDKILIKSERLQWLIKKGLIVTKIYGSIKTERGVIFDEFVKKVSDERRKGDVDVDYAIIAEMWKLLGNSAFGRTGMNKNKFYKTVYGDEETYFKYVKSNLLQDVNVYGELYEITLKSRNVNQNVPIQVACSIYDDAKLLMCQFYYDCLSKYISRDCFQYIEMDTDSAYMGLTDDFMDSDGKISLALIKPNMVEEFLKDKNNWFLRDDSKEHNKFDKRKAGLFKPEFVGAEMVSLCSKSYKVRGFEVNGIVKCKMSCKGVQHSHNADKLTMESYKDVLYNNVVHMVKNRGMRFMNVKTEDDDRKHKKIYNYEVDKIGLSGKYDKRRVLNDGVSTVPLNI